MQRCFQILCATVLFFSTATVAQQGPTRVDVAREDGNRTVSSLPDVPDAYSLAKNEVAANDPADATTQGNSEQAQHDSSQQSLSDADSQTGSISGTVTNLNGDIVPGATVALEDGQSKDRRTAVATDSGFFQFDKLPPGTSYQVSIDAKDLESWKSQLIVLRPGQYFLMTNIKMKIPDSVVSVTVYATQEQIAAEQVEIQEKQRIFGFIPNFYVTYDPHPVPLTTKLKFKLAYKATADPVTLLGVTFMAAIYQAGDIPAYGQGWDAYAKRVGAGYADTTSDIFIGGAILPWLLKQDPRYFYQGTGTKKSRTLHAMASPYVCKGDNGKLQPNFSSMGGDLASGALSNLYYPKSDRGVGLLFQGFLITTGVRTVNAVIQEFVLRKLTPSARSKN
jgi:Carboxypeptidase regulatory-like domain